MLPVGVVGRAGRGGAPAGRLEGALLFREVQGFGWPWPGILIVLVGFVTFGSVLVPFSYGLWQQLVLGRPWGDRPMPDAVFAVVGPLAILLSLLPLFVLLARLVVEVRADGVRIELRRLKGAQVIRPDQVRELKLARMGLGWGCRRHWKTTVYRMAGPEGVEIDLLDGKRVVVGSERPRRLLEALLSMKEGEGRPR
jgi:hypothetical protein